VFTRIVVSSELFADLRAAVFSHDYDKFHLHPSFRLTDEQARRLLMVTDVLSVIVAHDSRDLKLRQQLMLYQLAIGYEFLNYYRRELDREGPNNRQLDIYHRFCELVVAHYKESREIQFYARQLDLTPKYFSQVIRSATNGISPGQWIEQYVATQTKRLIQARPNASLKEIAYEIGFNEPSSFYRYFKRATGMTAKEFKES
jgi:AraC-like DNA-binding protein